MVVPCTNKNDISKFAGCDFVIKTKANKQIAVSLVSAKASAYGSKTAVVTLNLKGTKVADVKALCFGGQWADGFTFVTVTMDGAKVAKNTTCKQAYKVGATGKYGRSGF
jgi:hypothetical protein